jgi:hypothetical protein
MVGFRCCPEILIRCATCSVDDAKISRPFAKGRQGPMFSVYASNSLTGDPVLSSSELAIFTGRPMGLMYSFFQSMPSVW